MFNRCQIDKINKHKPVKNKNAHKANANCAIQHRQQIKSNQMCIMWMKKKNNIYFTFIEMHRFALFRIKKWNEYKFNRWPNFQNDGSYSSILFLFDMPKAMGEFVKFVCWITKVPGMLETV